MRAFTDSPLFYNGVPLSATDINILSRNAMILDGLSKRAQSTHSINRMNGSIIRGKWMWRGGFMYKTGMTTARFVYVGQAGYTGRLGIYFDGVRVLNVPAGQSANLDFAINDKGYTNGQVIRVEAIVDPENDVEPCCDKQFYIADAYTFPLDTMSTSAWPGLPSFDTINATKLNQLSNALDWLAERISFTPYVHFMSLRNWQGSATPENRLIWTGTVSPIGENNRLKGYIEITSRNTETYILVASGTANVLFGPVAFRETKGFDINIATADMGMTPNVDYKVSVYEHVVQGNPPKAFKEWHKSRINLRELYIGADNYTMSTIPTKTTMLEGMSYATLKARLQAISTIATNVKNTIDNNPRVFNRAQMFRDRYAYDMSQVEYWEQEMIASQIRRGDVLYVSGKGLSIGYGPIKTTIDADDEKWEYEFQYSENLTDGDAYETKIFYLDQFEGLYPGTPYYIQGKDLVYCAEFLR